MKKILLDLFLVWMIEIDKYVNEDYLFDFCMLLCHHFCSYTIYCELFVFADIYQIALLTCWVAHPAYMLRTFIFRGPIWLIGQFFHRALSHVYAGHLGTMWPCPAYVPKTTMGSLKKWGTQCVWAWLSTKNTNFQGRAKKLWPLLDSKLCKQVLLTIR